MEKLLIIIAILAIAATAWSGNFGWYYPPGDKNAPFECSGGRGLYLSEQDGKRIFRCAEDMPWGNEKYSATKPKKEKSCRWEIKKIKTTKIPDGWEPMNAVDKTQHDSQLGYIYDYEIWLKRRVCE